MSISNITPTGPKPLGSANIGQRNDINGQSRLQQQQPKVQIPRTARDDKAPATPAQALRGSVTLAPPPGTDPALWSILTNDERAHFAASGARGPLTYGATMRGHTPPPAPATARGGRLDVKA